MGFLKRFFRNVFRDGAEVGTTSSFAKLSEEELEAHLGVARYGDFILTDAVRPSFDLQVVPEVPREPHDEPLDVVATDQRVLVFSRRQGGPRASVR